MTRSSPLPATATDFSPHLLYYLDTDQARFATWRLAEGHETLALFTSEESAKKYALELTEPAHWLVHQPCRDKLLTILHACRSTGILYAALDPQSGSAKTLFDIPRILDSVSDP